MTLHTGISVRHVNAYHHDNGLLFQFILAEFLDAFEEIRQLDNLCKLRPAVSHLDHSHPLQHETVQDQIDISLATLTGSARNYMGLLSGGSAEGILGKLKIYCSLFHQNIEHDDKHHLAIRHYTEKVWQGCLQAVDTWHEDLIDRTAFFSAVEKTVQEMQRLSKLIVKAITPFRDDENVIFYVIRHKEQFDTIYGHRFVHKLLSRLYPKGLRQAQQLLIQKYTERGFDNIIPVIVNKFAEIEASTT